MQEYYILRLKEPNLITFITKEISVVQSKFSPKILAYSVYGGI